MRNLALLLFVISAVGCGGVDCAEGTFPSGDNCVGFDPNDNSAPAPTIDPPGRRSRDPLPGLAVITTDEPATVFVTTDGSDPDPDVGTGGKSPVVITDIVDGMTVKFLAVDRAGNRSEIGTATYFSDTTPPALASNLQLVFGGVDGDEATITWTNPTDPDFAGAVLARVVDLIDAEPEDGQLLTAPGSLSPSLQIIQSGTTTQFVDPGVARGTVRYVVWTHDDLGNYSQPAAVRAERDVGSLAIELSYDTTNNQLTIPTLPPALDITATSSRNANQVTINLTISSLANKAFQNPKLELTSQTNASFANSDGTADGRAFKFIGPNALVPAVPTPGTLVFNVTPGTVATIELVLASHPSLIFERGRQDTGKTGFVDLEVLSERPAFTPAGGGNNNRPGRMRPGTLVGERFMDLPTSHGSIERWDLATNSRVAGVVLAQPRGGGNQNRSNIMGLFKTETNVFAVVKGAGHRASGEISVVRLNEGLRETGRLELPFGFERGIATMAISSDGVIAIPANTQIVLVDTKTLTLLDADPSTPGVEEILPTGLNDRIRSLAFLGPNRLAAMSRQTGEIAIIEFGASGISGSLLSGFSGRGHQLATAPDGRLWIAIDSGLRVYDPVTGDITDPNYPAVAGALTFVNGQLAILRNNRTTIDRVNPATGQITRTLTLPIEVFQHWLFSTSR